MKPTVPWLVVCALVVAPATAPAQEQTREQKRCILTLLGDTLAVAKVQSDTNAGCVRAAGQGDVPYLSDCLVSGEDDLAPALQRTTDDALALCAETPPDFGLPAAYEQTLNDAAVVHERGVLADLFGSDPDGAIIATTDNEAGAKCQAQVVKRTEALVAARMKSFPSCVKNLLKKRPTNDEQFAGCIRGELRGGAKKAAKKLRADVGRRCQGIDLSEAFPGRCADASGDAFADCVVARTACRACRLAGTASAIDVDCDQVDDGTDNGSCSFPVSLSGDAIPFVGGPDGRVEGATITIVEEPLRQVVTSANGAFLFEDLEEGDEVTLALVHPDYHPIQTGTIRLGASGASRVTFQAVTYTVYDLLAELLDVVPDDANRCQMVTTVTRVGKSIYDPGAHGEDLTTVTLAPPLPAEHGPIYFNSSVLPDPTLAETSDDGGVLFIQVPPGEYVWTAHKPGVLISRVKMKCRVGFLVNASPPWGLQAH
jgi:hypothetical protein